MSDSTVGNREFRTAAAAAFNMIDDVTREALVIDVDTSLSSKRIIRILERVIEPRGTPDSIRSDNGPEFTCGGGPLEEFSNVV